jgi:hypothetical protein
MTTLVLVRAELSAMNLNDKSCSVLTRDQVEYYIAACLAGLAGTFLCSMARRRHF